MSLKCGRAGRNRVVGVGVSVQRYRERFSEAVCRGTAMERELARDRVRSGRLSDTEGACTRASLHGKDPRGREIHYM